VWLWSPSGPPVECVGDVGKGLSQGGQVPVTYPPGIQLGDELGQRCWPCRALGDFGDGHFLNDGDEPVDLDDPVDDLDGGAPRNGCTGVWSLSCRPWETGQWSCTPRSSCTEQKRPLTAWV
jgi:hypothetical protein